MYNACTFGGVCMLRKLFRPPVTHLALSALGFAAMFLVSCNGLPALPDQQFLDRAEQTHRRIEQLKAQIEELIQRQKAGEQIDRKQVDQLYTELWRMYDDYKFFRDELARRAREENRSPWELLIWGIATYLGMHYGRKGFGSLIGRNNGNGNTHA